MRSAVRIETTSSGQVFLLNHHCKKNSTQINWIDVDCRGSHIQFRVFFCFF